jgi:hypothetical protein
MPENSVKTNASQKQSKALRYLILRHLWRYHKSISNNDYIDVTSSLSVEKNRNVFLIKWNRQNKSHSVEIPKVEFSFFSRDMDNPSRESVDSANKNDTKAQKLADQILNVSTDSDFGLVNKKESLELHSWFTLICSWLGCFSLLFPLGFAHFPIVIVLGIIISLEYLSFKGKSLSSIGFIVFVFFNFPWLAFAGGFVYGVLQFLDPNPFLRSIRIFFSFAASLSGLYVIVTLSKTQHLGLGTIVPLVVFLLLIISRITQMAHFRSMPLVLPIFIPAFYLEGYSYAGWMIAGLSLISFVYVVGYYKIVKHPTFKV